MICPILAVWSDRASMFLGLPSAVGDFVRTEGPTLYSVETTKVGPFCSPQPFCGLRFDDFGIWFFMVFFSASCTPDRPCLTSEPPSASLIIPG